MPSKVVDTGIGVASEEIARVLEPFAQVGDIMSRSHEGAELHGGTLELEREIGKGTTVTVRFPSERTIRTS